jgi:N-carbamoyl-L-amino-acid hydrolase
MNARQDALVGAAKIIEKVNSHAKTIWLSNNHLVATVGKISVLPNASNAVPGEVRFSLEIRSDNQNRLDNFLNTIIQWAKDKICKQDQLRIQYRPLSIAKPIFFTKSIINQVAHAATSLGLSWMNIKSGAGHDAGYMANLCPSAMIFVPCYDGRSHCPEENITIKDAMNGANVLTQSLLLLDRNKSYRTKK